MRRDGNEQITIFHPYVPQVMDRSGITHFGQQVIVGAQVPQAVVALIEQTDFHILAAHHVARKGVVFVAVHALDGHGLAVDAQQAVLNLHRAETNLLLNRLDGNSIFVFQPDCDGVEIRTLCRPRFYAAGS